MGKRQGGKSSYKYTVDVSAWHGRDTNTELIPSWGSTERRPSPCTLIGIAHDDDEYELM